ncbi:tenascin-N isoform X1 [Neolamprologus brichardi]|uniref:tenascin-N isoform X1 n=1 Tax=Neolamprologus brichardi TaxID=32507 RepID=UPI001643EC2D|nr:tenascin-N isoform X1 [Neolamprologus brichardi]
MTARPLWRALCLLALLCTWSCTSSADTQPDPSAAEQEVTLSHIYKIDIPGSTSCNLQHISTQDETGLQMETTKTGNNDIIFRHNIKLQSPRCDCEESESFKSLLYRVNGLEEEVNYLKTQCAQGCCGAAGVDKSCSGHGTYQQDTCSCLCNVGWEGPDCSESSCPDECNDNGRCVDGRCICHEGYTGEDCSELTCPDNCNDKGRCVDGQCVCYEGYTGEDCSELACPNNCNDKGQCVDGKCVCFSHFAGEDCSNQKCPNDCTDNGQCVNGKCICDDGFYGEDCSLVLAPQGLQVVQVTDVSLLVEWESVQGAEYYVLTYYPKNDEGAQEQISVANTESSYLITGLTPGVTYIVQVHAVIKEIQSEADKIEATTDVSTIDGIRVLGQTDVSIEVDWQNPRAEMDYFRLTHTDPEGQEEELKVQRSQEARTKHTIVGLYPGTEYAISVQAIKGNNGGKASSVTGATDIDAPTNLVTTEVTEDTATVSWDQAQAHIEGYMLSYTSAEGSSSDISVARDSTSYRLIGLRPGVLHTVYIWAYKGDKVSGKSSTEAETNLDAPTNVFAQDETEFSFRVHWDPPQAEIDGYMLTYSSSEGSSEEIVIGSDSTSYTLTGLRPGVLYTVYIWAVKGSKASRKISTQAETELDAPANLLARDETESSFTVSWDPAQAEIDGYILTYTSSEGSSEEIPVGSDRTSYMLTSLRPGVLYTVYIWAIKGDKATRKISTKAQTDIDSPKDLRAVDVTLDSASLTWTPPLADIEGYILTYRDEEGNMETVEKQLVAGESSFAASSLEMGKRYIVTIIAYRGNKRSKVVETIFKTVGLLHPFPMDCVQIMKNGNNRNGVYTVYINNDRSKPIEAYCDMDTDGGGWLVLQRRNIGKLDFMKRWRQYIAGFGNLTEEFWIGLDKIYELTNTPTQYELRFDLGVGSERAYAVYDNFKIAPVKQKFKLTIGKYSGTAGDAMTYHQGLPWTTIDSDNDIALTNCALSHRGAWWYKNCHLANLNGKWGETRHSMGVNWEPWKGHLTSLDFSEMKIRPVGALSSRKRRSLAAREKSRNAKLQKK